MRENFLDGYSFDFSEVKFVRYSMYGLIFWEYNNEEEKFYSS